MGSHSDRARTWALLALALALLLVAGAIGWWLIRRAAAGSREVPPAVLHFRAGVRLAEAGDPERALGEWRVARALDPAYPDPYFAVATAHEQAGDFAAAASELEVLRRANPGALHVECRQADLYFKADRYERALATAREAVRRQPDCPLARAVLGMTLELAGATRGALDELRAAHRLAPEGERVTLTLAQALGRAGMAEEALALVRPLFGNTRLPLQANYIMGWLASGPADLAPRRQALGYLRKALVIDPNYAPANAAMGRLLVRIGRVREARPYLERARAAGDPDGEAASDLAVVYGRLGLRAEGRQASSEAGSLKRFLAGLRGARHRYLTHPEDLPNCLRLARMEAERGNSSDALDLVKRVLEEEPDNRTALALLRRLAIPRS